MSHIPQSLLTGPWFQNTGIGSPTGQWLLPEETLLMVSSGRLELLDEDGFEMGVLGAWGACIEPAGGVNTYLVWNLFQVFESEVDSRCIRSYGGRAIMFLGRVI